MPTKYLTAAETATLVRKALKAQFPAFKFSVRTREYAGGASLDVAWTDGPHEKAVQQVTSQFRGADFDSSQDLMTYREGPASVTAGGELERVSYGADFIHTRREYSACYGRWCSGLDLYQAPALSEQLRGMFALLTAGGCPTDGVSFGEQHGNGILTGHSYDAAHSFEQWAPKLRAQGYTVEVEAEPTSSGPLHTLAIYRPARAAA